MAESTPFKPNLTVSPTVAMLGMPSQNKNFAEIIGKAFDDFGDIYKEKEKREERQVDMADKNLAREVSQINLSKIKEDIKEKSNFGKFLASGKTIEEWNTNKDFAITNPEYVEAGQKYFTQKKELFTKEEIEKATNVARTKYTKEDGTFDFSGASKELNQKFLNNELEPLVFSGSMDIITKLYKENKPKYTQKTITDAVDENGKPATQLLTIDENGKTIKTEYIPKYIDPLDTTEKDLKIKKLQKDINTPVGGSGDGGFKATVNAPSTIDEVKKNYKLAYGRDIDTITLAKFKKDGTVPYKVYGQDGSDKKFEKITKHLELSRDIAEMKEIVARNPNALENITGLTRGNVASSFIKQTLGLDSADATRLRTLIANINSVNKHELFGAALTAKESSNAFQWDLTQIKDAKNILNTINLMEEKNKSSYEFNKKGYIGVPALHQFIPQKTETKQQTKQPTQYKPQQQKQQQVTTKQTPPQTQRTIVRTGTLNGRKVIQYSDGTTEYAK